ncbi:unnamed protein product, partial [marine sediment metagenome]
MPIAVLISGGGTTLRNLLEKIDAGRLHVAVRLVICSSAEAKGLEYAQRDDIEQQVVRRADHADQNEFSRTIFDHCRRAGVEYVV